jgi:hypothetical protein
LLLRAAPQGVRWRRRRVLRSFLGLTAMTAALVAVVVWQRNSVRLTYASERFEHHLVDLIRTYVTTGTLPLSYPARQPEVPSIPRHEFRYIDADMARCLRDTDQPLIVAYTPSIRQVLSADVRLVAVKRGDIIDLEAWPTGRFNGAFAAQRSATEQAIQRARRAGPRLP